MQPLVMPSELKQKTTEIDLREFADQLSGADNAVEICTTNPTLQFWILHTFLRSKISSSNLDLHYNYNIMLGTTAVPN